MPFRSNVAKKVSKLPYPKASRFKELYFSVPNSEINYFSNQLQQTNTTCLHDQINNLTEADIKQIAKLPLTASCYDIDIFCSPTILSFNTQEVVIQSDILQPELFLRSQYININEIEINFISISIVFDVNLDVIKFDYIKVSSDLLKLFFINYIEVYGKNYSDKYWEKTRIEVNYSRKVRKSYEYELEKIVSTDNPPKQETPGNHNKKEFENLNRNSYSFWDLIFIILQPPLQLELSHPTLIPHKLYSYQIIGVEFLLKNDHALLADDMGTGKTVMTLIALKLLFQKGLIHHVLILCPKSVIYEWRRHLDEWAPELIYTQIQGQSDIRRLTWSKLFHVYISSYDTFASDMLENRIIAPQLFDTVIIDEAHNIKNPKTRRFRALKKLSAFKRWALTGTPIQNSIEDLYTIFEFIHPGYLSKIDLYPNIFDESEHETLLKKIEPHFIRRRKIDVLADLPAKQRQEFWLELDEDQRIEYNIVNGQIRDELINIDKNSPYLRRFFRNKLFQLKQICNFATNKITSPKTDLLIKQIEEIVSGENKIIIFTQFLTQGIDKIINIIKHNFGVAVIQGKQSDQEREREIERFKKLKDINVLVASIRAGGEGLNLTEASYVVHFDHWWNPAVMWQAEDRVHRPGQTRGVNIYSYWMEDSVDERIYNILQNKQKLIKNTIETMAKDEIEQILTNEDMYTIFDIEPVGEKKYIPKTSTIKKSLSIREGQKKLQSLTPYEFEKLISEFMKYLGYSNVKVTGKTNDGGIDVLCSKFKSNGEIDKAVVQCKRYKGKVGVKIAREFYGAIADHDSIQKGYLITTGYFTKECLSFCERSEKIIPISGLQLSKYLIQFGLV